MEDGIFSTFNFSEHMYSSWLTVTMLLSTVIAAIHIPISVNTSTGMLLCLILAGLDPREIWPDHLVWSCSMVSFTQWYFIYACKFFLPGSLTEVATSVSEAPLEVSVPPSINLKQRKDKHINVNKEIIFH